MGEASRLGKKGKSLTARRLSSSVWVIVGYGVEYCGFDSFHCFYFYLFTFSCLFYPIVHYTAAYAATDAVCFLLFLPWFSSLLSGIPGSCLLKTDLFTRERGRNMICYISCDTGDTAYAVKLRFAFYTLERDVERLVFARQASTEGEASTCLGQAASSLDGRCLD